MVVKKSSDGVVAFYEKSHKYKNLKTKKYYTSATTLIGKHFPKFDAKKVARFLAGLPFAKKQKKGVRYWLKEWKNSAEEGTFIHAELEKLINNPSDYTALKPVLHPRTIIAWEGFMDLHRGFDEPHLTAEELIYDDEYGISGQIDVLISENCEEGRCVTLFDWKATKDISFRYKYSNEDEKFGTSEFTNHLENCNGNKYSIQLSLYAYLLERKGHKIKDLYIGHICPKKGKLVPIKVEYMKDVVKSMLEDFKNGMG